MGYCMWQVDTQEFFIPCEKVDAVVAALNRFSGTEKTLAEHMNDAGFEVEKDNAGNVDGLYFVGEKLSDQYELLCVLVPFVRDGAFLEFIGEDFSRWRWVFRNGRLEEIYPKVIWN